MKKTNLIAILLIFISFSCFSQVRSKKVSISSGKEMKKTRKNIFGGVLADDVTGIYVGRTSINLLLRTKFYIEHYNTQLKKTKTQPIEIEYKDKKLTFEKTIDFNNRIYVISSFLNQSSKKNYLFAQTIDKKTLTLNNDLKKIAEYEYEKRRDKYSGGYSFDISEDESKLLIYYNLPYQRKENEKFGFHVFDADFNQMWEKEVTLPYTDQLFKVNDYILDNNGNVFLLGKLYKDKVKEERKGEINYTYTILSYTENGAQENKFPISVSDVFITDMKIAVTPEFDIIGSGFYSDNASNSVKGAFYVRFDTKTNSLQSKSFKDFDFDFITENLNERQTKRAKKRADKGKEVELTHMYLDDIIMRDDGGAVLIGEKYRMYTTEYTTTNSNGTTTTHTVDHYVYGDIVMVNINADGTIAWTRKIPKYQHSTNDGGALSSYAKRVKDDKIFFIFNDNPKNLTQNDKNKVYTYSGLKRSIAVLVEVDIAGNVSDKELIFSSKAEGVLIQPSTSSKINDNEMIFYAIGKKKEKFIKMTFK